MKKLDAKELKKIKGGSNPFCRRHCLKVYENCLSNPSPAYDCQALYDECVYACDN